MELDGSASCVRCKQVGTWQRSATHISREGHLMHMRSLVIILCSLVFVAGCTPFGDGVLRKTDQEQVEERNTLSVDRMDRSRVPEPLVDGQTRKIVRVYGPTIKHYAELYGLDWRLILATMKQESRFSPTAESHRGAYGLMQLMPGTGEDIARELSVEDLSHPHDNIRGGIYYLRQLYDMFEGAPESDRIKLALAAYNAGIGRIYDAQELAAYLRENPHEWNAIKDMLPLLSRRYESLHRSVWNQERPKTGFFGNSGETIQYVENVMSHYDEYQLMLN